MGEGRGGRTAALLLAAALVAAACVTTEPRPPRDVLGSIAADVVESRFGVVLPTDQGNQFRPTRFVLLVPGTTFGWGIKLADRKGKVSWAEEYSLPAPPASVGGARQSDPTLVRREGREELDQGWLSKYWTLDGGDPPGRHIIDVFIDGERAHTFEFDVVPLPPQ